MVTKKCSNCKEKKYLYEFHKSKATFDKLTYLCKKCNCLKTSIWRKNNPLKYKELLKDYYKKNTEKLKLKAKKWSERNIKKRKIICKRWYYNNPEKVKINHNRANSNIKNKIKKHNYSLKKFYNLSSEEYENMLKLQNNVCAICGKSNANGIRLFVDHDHKTGKTRKLLCCNCNMGLGAFKDDVNLLKKAIDYLLCF